MTLPGRSHGRGGVHPISRALERIEAIFASMGFEVADGPEIETDWYSFTALNNPANHPARSMQDTFYVDLKDDEGRWLNLRPHTSPMQIRHAQAHARRHAGAATMPDVRVIAPGRTYRVDSDATHSPMFHQVEGLWLGENVSFRDLKALYLDFIQAFFETTELKLRFRPSYFPFTEPSAEIDVMFERGPLAGRWLEVSGSGQVHPQVVRNMGFDPERVIGFRLRFGHRPTRHAALRHRRPAPFLRRRLAVSPPVRLSRTGAVMQFPESWLREFCDPPISSAELAERLTMAGLEVESTRSVAPPFHGVVVAEGAVGREASECRPTSRLPGRCGPWRNAGHRLRSAERSCRYQGAARSRRRRVTTDGRGRWPVSHRDRQDSRGREPRHALLGA